VTATPDSMNPPNHLSFGVNYASQEFEDVRINTPLGSKKLTI